MKKHSKKKWEYSDESANKWVVCLSCGHEYFIESFELNPECIVCGSKEYEEDECDEEEWE